MHWSDVALYLLKQEMTANIAHELKTPVSSIRGYLEILLGPHPVDDDRRHYYLERCYAQTLRLSDLIQDVSLINKIEESASLFPREEHDLHSIVQEAIRDLVDAASSRHIDLLNRLPHPMPIRGSHELLYSIFRNLIENAIAHAGEHITVAIEPYQIEHGKVMLETPPSTPTTTEASTYYLHLYDTGCGIPDEYLSRLFDRFVRIDSGRSRSRGGTGLGLSIVKHAVLFHDGQIYAKNRPEGGLEFFFSLKKE